MTAAGELLAAIAAGDADRVRELLEGDPGLAAARGADGVSAVARAAYLQHRDLVEALLALEPELDVADAAITGRTERLAELLTADPTLAASLTADGFTPLHLAAFFGHPAAVRLLLAAGSDPSAPARNAMRVAPLHSAAARPSAECAALLVGAGADLDARQAGGLTALMAAAHAGHAELVTLLLDAGADPALRDDDGRSAADHAAAGFHDPRLA